MLLRPKWLRLTPSHLRPDEERVRALEQLRVHFRIPHSDLAMRVTGSPATTRKVLRECLRDIMAVSPEASAKDLLRMLFVSRVQSSPGHYGMTDENIEQAMQTVSSFDGLCDLVESIEERYAEEEDDIGIGRMIDEILAGEEADRKKPAENLIQSLHRAYSELRQKHPDRDEHWLLTNTWLARYGATRRAEERGPEWTTFRAYVQSHQFSIMEPPLSIRALALWCVYKELGDDHALDYAIEFTQMMEPVWACDENNTFLEKYKERNPRTWRENQVETPSPYSLYWLFKGMEFQRERPQKAEELFSRLEALEDEPPEQAGRSFWPRRAGK